MMRWAEAAMGMGFSPSGPIKGWRYTNQTMEIWYRMGNADMARDELFHLLEWAFGPGTYRESAKPHSQWDWRNAIVSAEISIHSERVQAVVVECQPGILASTAGDLQGWVVTPIH
jgi:hypothetical protein